LFARVSALWLEGQSLSMSIMVFVTGKAATIKCAYSRDAAAIENFRKVDTLIVDKTGTLTGRKAALLTKP
jgi:Cu+-exporting ATPase